MNPRRKSTRFAVLGLLLLATVGSLVGVSAAAPPITIAQLAGPWQVAVTGNTGCGVSSLLYNGKLDSIGHSTGTLTGSSAGCGSSTTTETFNILTLNGNGSGTAGLTCGAGCGWVFNIQVSRNKQVINMVDVHDGGSNVLAGTAVKQTVTP
ncbi:MAG: hypothetical protein DMG80_08435 [Acidobacteria bacterium]|jgi:hypothetical protein|nr:MAG: hypothetical protein DMG80_08435 [Acidobacteriota bacterium]